MKSLTYAILAAAMGAAPALAHEEPKKPDTNEAAAYSNEVLVKPKVKLNPTPHSGGTDSNGCHMNHKTGDYHCHNPK